MTTVRDLIRDSLGLINVVGAGEDLTAEDAVDNLNAMNRMLDTWAAGGLTIYSRSIDTHTLLGNVQTYTMGPGGDINTPRPTIIQQATITLGSIVTPMNIWAQDAFATLPMPTLQGAYPTDLFVNNGSPLLTLKFYPIPVSGMVFTCYSLKKMTDLTLNSVIEMPPGYQDAIIYNLAVRRAPAYEREALPTVKNTALAAYNAIVANNLQYSEPTMAVDIALWPRYSDANWQYGFNIFSGTYN